MQSELIKRPVFLFCFSPAHIILFFISNNVSRCNRYRSFISNVIKRCILNNFLGIQVPMINKNYNCYRARKYKMYFLAQKSFINSADAYGGPRSSVCAHAKLRSAPHWHQWKFLGTCLEKEPKKSTPNTNRMLNFRTLQQRLLGEK